MSIEKITMHGKFAIFAAILSITQLSSCTTVKHDIITIELTTRTPISEEEARDKLKYLQELLKSQPDSVKLYIEMARIHRKVATPISRARGIELLDKALLKDPKNYDAHITKALILLDGGFYKLASEELKKAISSNKKAHEPWALLGYIEEKKYMKNCIYKNHLEKAIHNYRKALKINDKDSGIMYHLSLCYFLTGRYKNSISLLKKLIEQCPSCKEAYLLAGTCYVKLKDFDKAKEQFQAAFNLMDKSEVDYYEDISVLLDTEDAEIYRSSSRMRRHTWNRNFWAENDPTPATEINEMRLEHYARAFIAQILFTIPALDIQGAYSDRGKVLVRFGEPDSIDFDSGSFKEGYTIKWHYFLQDEIVTFQFLDEFLNGNYHFAIEDFSGELYEKLLSELPPRLSLTTDFTEVPIYMVLYQFKGDYGKIKIDCGIGVNSEIRKKSPETIRLYFSIMDTGYKRILESTTTIDPDTLYEIVKYREKITLIHLPLEIPPLEGSILVAVEIVNDSGKVKALSKSYFELVDLEGQRPSLSGIKLSIVSKNEKCTPLPDPLPVYTSGDNICAVYEIYNLKVNNNGLASYVISYQIDSLKPVEGLYAKGLKGTLLYILRKLKLREDKKSTIITSSFEQSTSANRAVQKTIINTRGFKSGPYEISIRVKDITTGKTNSRKSYFLIR